MGGVWEKSWICEGKSTRKKSIEEKNEKRGIKEKDIHRIFEAGFTSTSDHHDDQSTGMGMYLTKEVCVALAINIDVTSVYGDYTTVTLTFSKANEFSKITMK